MYDLDGVCGLTGLLARVAARAASRTAENNRDDGHESPQLSLLSKTSFDVLFVD